MAATNSPIDHLDVDGDESVRWYVPDEEPEVAYGFCSHCGSTLFWRSADRPTSISICAGTLDPPTGLSTVHALFTAEASDYHRLDEGLSSHPHDSGGGVVL